jgi:hypothetical protein
VIKLIWAGAAFDAAIAGKVLAATGTRYTNTITLGTVIVGMLVVIVAGVFTIRANTAKIWRQNYEGEKARADNLAADLVRVTAEKDVQIAEQRGMKHSALAEVAALKLTDQRAVLAQLKEMAEMTVQVSKAVAGILKTNEALVGSVEKLNKRLDRVESDRPITQGGTA